MTTEGIESFHLDKNKIEVVDNFIFLRAEITADGGCTKETCPRIAPGRAAMDSLGTVMKKRGVNVTSKIWLLYAMVFPVALYGFESWTMKMADRCGIDVFKLWCCEQS